MADWHSTDWRRIVRAGRDTRALVAAGMIVALAGCSGSGEPEPDTAPGTPAAESSPSDPEDDPSTTRAAAEAVAPDARGLTRMANAEASRPATVAPVAFERLVALLPIVEGWERGEPQGEEHAVPVPYTTAQALYTRDDQTVRLELVDSGFQPLLLTPHEMFLSPAFAERDSQGFTRATTLGGAPGYVRWNSARLRGEVVAVAGRRFILMATGVNVPEVATVERVASQVDLRALGGLR